MSNRTTHLALFCLNKERSKLVGHSAHTQLRTSCRPYHSLLLRHRLKKESIIPVECLGEQLLSISGPQMLPL